MCFLYIIHLINHIICEINDCLQVLKDDTIEN